MVMDQRDPNTRDMSLRDSSTAGMKHLEYSPRRAKFWRNHRWRKYFSENTQALTLPPSTPLSRGHAWAFSYASAWSLPCNSGRLDVTLPAPTLPISIISLQPFVQTLKILMLTNRHLDISISLPLEYDLLPSLEELNLDGCGLCDTIPVSRQDIVSSSGVTTPSQSTELLLPFLAKLFPNLQTLNLSDNALTSASLMTGTLLALVLALNDGSTKTGLKHLRIRGNWLAELDRMQIYSRGIGQCQSGCLKNLIYKTMRLGGSLLNWGYFHWRCSLWMVMHNQFSIVHPEDLITTPTFPFNSTNINSATSIPHCLPSPPPIDWTFHLPNPLLDTYCEKIYIVNNL